MPDSIVETVSWVVGIGAGLWVCDRIALAAEDRGWIYWRRRQPDRSTAANAMLELQSIVEPQKAHVVEERRVESRDVDSEGAPRVPVWRR